MHEERDMPAVAMLPDGRILVAGGHGHTTQGPASPMRTAELWNPDAKAWTGLPDMSHPRTGAAACVLACGDVMVVGGICGYDTGRIVRRRDAEFFDPVTLKWRDKCSDMAYARGVPGLAVVPGGAVAIGSQNHMDNGAANVEIYDEDTGRWFRLPHAMAKPRVAGSLITLPASAFRRV